MASDDGHRLAQLRQILQETERELHALTGTPQLPSDPTLRAAARVARLGGWSVTIADRKLTWSGESAAIHDEPAGFTPELDDILKYHQPQFRELSQAAFVACRANGTPFQFEAQIITAKARKAWIRVSGEAVRDAAGKVIEMQGAYQDISSERALVEQLSVLGESLDTISDAFFTLDRDWRFTYLNAAAEGFLRRTRAELLGKKIWDEFKQSVGTTSDIEYHRVMDQGLTVTFEQYYPPLARWFDAKAYPTQRGIAVYFRDITELRSNREAMRDQATLLDRASDAIVVRDLEHRVLYWNRSAQRIYGWTSAEAMGRSMALLLHPTEAVFRAATLQTLAEGEWKGEIEKSNRDRRVLTIEASWTLVRDEAGQPRSIMSIDTDITQRKKLEGQFLRAQRMESIGALAGGIAHDLNNTLAPILMTVGLLREQEKDPSRRDDLETIEVCSQRAAEMVGQLLNFARGVDGRRVRTRVGQITSEVQKIIRDSFPKDVVLNVTLPNDQWELNADPTQLHQLLMNLAVNARDAMPHGGVITLAVEHVILDEVYAGMNLEAKPGPYVLLRIEDTGVGMPREIVERIFDPFFTTKEVGKGTGLGLSTAHSIVRGHGGFIHVYSEVGEGTRFHVYLPADVEASAAEEVAIEQSSMPRGKGELVLVVDDEEIIRSVAKRTLERFGYRVMLANHGAEAVSQYAQHGKEIDVVLTDMSMPVMDGPATIVALRSLNPRVKIIGSSGLNANGNVAKAVGAGVQHFVPKPYTADVMLRVLRKILTEG